METKTTQEGAASGLTPAATAAIEEKEPLPFKRAGKVHDPVYRPFHRVSSPTYDDKVDDDPQHKISKERPSGKGYGCGCRSPDDYTQSALFDGLVDGVFEGLKGALNTAVPGAQEAYERLRAALKEETGTDFEDDLKRWLANTIEGAIFRSYLRFIPSWVPVNRIGYETRFRGADGKETTKEAEVEVEGRLHRSYLTRHHRPYTQWSRFYHWSFQVEPAHGFKHLVGDGASMAPEDSDALSSGTHVGARERLIDLYVSRGEEDAPRSSFECMLDLGAMSTPPGDRAPLDPYQYPSILFDKKWPFWPQSGDYFWAAGRFVYDCTHATSADKSVGLHPTLINPTKAFAVGRYEAFRFEQMDDWVPAVRFMFFATRKGGYWDFDGDIKVTDQDYEFLVDLPPIPEELAEFAVGRTPQFMRNTLVVRPRLLKNIEFAPYGAGADSPLRWWRRDPVVHLVKPPPGQMPSMARVKIPMKEMPDNTDAYGFVVTLGWYSPELAARVKKVSVRMPTLKLVEDTDDLRLNICINGRWIYYPTVDPDKDEVFDVRDPKQNHPPPGGLILHLPDDGRVTLTTHGTKVKNLGEFMEEKPAFVEEDMSKDRSLAFGGLIPMSQETLDQLRELLEQKLGEEIPEGYWHDFDQVREYLNNETLRRILGDVANTILGDRRRAKWKEDVDWNESDPKQHHHKASTLAREMKVLPILNSSNEPMGMIEKGAGMFVIGTGVDPTVFEMRELIPPYEAKREGKGVDYHARVAGQTTDGGFMYYTLGGPDSVDYRLRFTIFLDEPDTGDGKK